MVKFKKLKKEEKVLFIALAGAITFSFYFSVIYKPISRKITHYKFQAEKSRAKLNELKIKLPETQKQEENIKALTMESQKLVKEIAEIEKTLPSEEGASSLLAQWTREAKDLNLVSIGQEVEAAEDYSKLIVEFKFIASYQDTVNYIRTLEAISPFLVIEELDITEPKDRSLGLGD